MRMDEGLDTGPTVRRGDRHRPRDHLRRAARPARGAGRAHDRLCAHGIERGVLPRAAARRRRDLREEAHPRGRPARLARSAARARAQGARVLALAGGVVRARGHAHQGDRGAGDGRREGPRAGRGGGRAPHRSPAARTRSGSCACSARANRPRRRASSCAAIRCRPAPASPAGRAGSWRTFAVSVTSSCSGSRGGVPSHDARASTSF